MKNPAAKAPQKMIAAKRAMRSRKKKERLRPISLYPLTFDSAVAALLTNCPKPTKPTKGKPLDL
jgi:predicted transcriptional regulator